MQWKRLVFFLLINIILSVLTTLIVLTIWDRSHRTEIPGSVDSSLAFVIPTATQEIPTAEPTIALQAYQISSGETLGEIALAFDITVDELLTLNGLDDPDSIGAGATIFVPVEKQVGSEESQIGSLPQDQGNPDGGAPPTSARQVEIVAVIGAGDLASERVQIRGLGEGSLSLTGWRLQDEDDHIYAFPQLTLFGNGAVNVYSTAGVDTVVALYWNSGEAVWESGETVTLFNENGLIQATYTVP
jgi:LysM repeat protein